MRRVPVALLTFLALGGSAVAVERAPAAHCTKVSDLKATLDKKDTLETLKPGAFHLAEGIWMATPPLSAEMPDVDGAIILTIDNESSLVFTHGKEGCIAPIAPFHLPAQWVRALSNVKTGAGEKAEPNNELSL